MGALLSKKYVIQIEDRKLTSKEFRNLKTYKDVLAIAGYTVSDTTTLRIIDKHSIYINACEPFQFRGTVIHEDKPIYIQKLY